jgi:hypothetical protein
VILWGLVVRAGSVVVEVYLVHFQGLQRLVEALGMDMT